MRVLLTGGAGFIGSAVVRRLVGSGHEVVVLDHRKPVTAGSVSVNLGDVRDPESWKTASEGVDAVIHLAAKVGLEQDLADMAAYVDHNDVGTAVGLGVLAAARFAGRLVLASSMVVYGEGSWACDVHGPVAPQPRQRCDLDAGLFDPRCVSCERVLRSLPVTETAPTAPRNVYAATKLHQEHLCQVFGSETGTSVIRLRYHNVYGPGMPRDTPYAGVAAIFADALGRGRPPLVNEDGLQRRDFVHVDDVARATVLAVEAPPETDGAFNIASGMARTVGEMADAVWRSAEASDDLRPVVTGRYRLGDVRHVVASPERADRELGFRAGVDFETGMRDLWADASLARQRADLHAQWA